jgi:hypothetical protein
MIIEQAVHLKQRNLEIFLRNRLLYTLITKLITP